MVAIIFFCRFFERPLHKFWDPDSRVDAIGARITEILRGMALGGAGMLSASNLYARLYRFDGYQKLSRNVGKKVAWIVATVADGTCRRRWKTKAQAPAKALDI